MLGRSCAVFNTTFTAVLAFSLNALSAAPVAQQINQQIAQRTNFNVVTQGEQSCTVGDKLQASERVCMPLLQKKNIELVEQVKLFQAYKEKQKVQPTQQFSSQQKEELFPSSLTESNQFGGALFLTDAHRAELLKHYSVVSIRNIGVDTEKVVKTNRGTEIPFIASVRWVGRLGLNGTVHVRGTVLMENSSATSGSAEGAQLDRKQMNDELSRMMTLNQFSDGNTEMNKEFMRNVERLGRFVHFKIVDLYGDYDQQTVQFLTNIVGPAVIGEVWVLAIANGINQVFDNIFQTKTKP